MRLLSSLKNRIFVACLLVAVLSIALAFRLISGRATEELATELRRGVRDAGSLVVERHAARLQTLAILARLVADLPKLKAALATADPPTVQPLASDYRARVKSDLFTVTDARGRVLASVGSSGATLDASTVAAALAGRELTTFRPGPRGFLQIVTVPVAVGPVPREILGTLSLGFILDDDLAEQLKAVTASEVAFVLEGRVAASTLPASAASHLVRLAETEGVSLLSLDGSPYEAAVRSLAPQSGETAPVVIVLRSHSVHLRLLRALRAASVMAALLAVVGAVVLSYVVARTVTRPLATITASMREMTATGDLSHKIRLRPPWDDEDASLLATTFNGLTDAISRFQREAALRDRLSALGRLSTVIAHEIRNPLMIIKSSLRTLRRPDAAAEERREASADVEHEITRLNRIVADVLDFARPVTLDPAPLDLNELCRAVGSSAAQEDTAPVLSLDPDLPTIVADGERLRGVLVNLLSNAREALAAVVASDVTSPGIELKTLALSPSRVAVIVADHGAGIEPEDLPRVFEPYFTSKRTGTGLGLAIAKNVVDSMGGSIDVRSRPGEGTEVRMELPTRQPASVSRQASG